MKLKSIILALLTLIVVLAFFLRFIKVTEIPSSLNWDEVSIGYNAYSILKTGKDEWGVFLPVHFRAYGEYKLPAQIYFSIPGIAVFGLNELGVRVTPVIYGTLTVLLLFFLARKLFKNNWIGLLSALLLAVSPWHIQLTRASFESSFAVFWIVWGMWWLTKGFENRKWWILAMIPMAMAMYTYNSARVFVPLFLLAVAFIHRLELLADKRILLAILVTFIVLLLPLVPYYLGGSGNSRYRLVSITDDPGLIPRIDEKRNLSTLPDPINKVLYNRVTYVSVYFAQHYLAHFTPDFLFINGAPHKQHHVQGLGELFYFQAPFILLGLLWMFRNRFKYRFLLLGWLSLAFVPVSVTNDSIPHALRTLIAAPVYQILTALGLYQAYLLVKRKKIVLIASFLLLITVIGLEFSHYLNQYYNIYPSAYSRDWQYGYKQVESFVKDHQDQYDQIVISRYYGEPQMFTLFYQNYDPAKYQNSPNLIRYEAFDWVWVLQFDKYYFPNLSDPGTHYEDIIKQNPGKKILFIGREDDFSTNIPRLLTVYFLDNQPAFAVVESK